MNNQNTTYKRLGDYIREVDVRNRDLSVSILLGLSMTKEFRPSTSNVVGTDLSKYKVVQEGQFAFDTMSVIRVHKVPICYNNLGYPIIISPAYITFEVIDESALNPQYLKLVINRSEFDRYADFKSDSAVRGGYNWEELCDTLIPIPDITEQQQIVNRYNAIQNRIETNKQTIAKLEEAAQALYRKMFIDNIDPNNLPPGWRMGTLGEICDISAGGDKPENYSEEKTDIYSIPIYSNGIENDGLYGYTDKAKIFKPSVTVSARGTIGFICLRTEPYVPIVRLLVLIPNNWIYQSMAYLYYLLNNTKLEGDGAVQLQLTAPKIKEIGVLIPTLDAVIKYDKMVTNLLKYKNIVVTENNKLKNI